VTLDSIRYEDVPGAKSNPLPHSRTLSTGLHDIKVFPSHALRKDHIEGSNSTNWTAPLNKPRISLRVDDIDGAQPNTASNFGPTHATIQTTRSCNPLCPAYKLPSHSRAEIQTPRFLRDSINIHDIETTTPQKLFLTPRASRLDARDIEGTTTLSRTSLLRQKHRQGDPQPRGIDSLRVKVSPPTEIRDKHIYMRALLTLSMRT
jgi:hypothetical protein